MIILVTESITESKCALSYKIWQIKICHRRQSRLILHGRLPVTRSPVIRDCGIAGDGGAAPVDRLPAISPLIVDKVGRPEVKISVGQLFGFLCFRLSNFPVFGFEFLTFGLQRF